MLKRTITLIFIGTFLSSGFSQINKRQAKKEIASYQKMKKEGSIPSNFKFSNPGILSKQIESDLETRGFIAKKKAAGCGCYTAPDATYTTAFAPNDDLSTASLPIPFSFCLYGTSYTDLYVNTNGNVSFDAPYSAFSSFAFPDPSFVMVAPFWGDVDTRGVGEVKYKITPTAMYVNWEGVGYYDSYTDKVNTFQLIITDGNDPILPPGNNIAFCYGDMQWTTGDASQGVNGFGGTPATVGANKGDGVDFFQLGRFDQAGAAYDGGGGLNDGVSWLDNQSFFFNVCSGNNIPPIANFTPAISTSGGGACDTVKICGVNDTLIVDALFLSPEIGETTTIAINFNGSPGFTTLYNNPGNPAEASVQLIAGPGNGGFNTITFTATDDGVPSQVTTVDYNIYVDTTGLSAFNPTVIGDLEFCEGDNSDLTVTPGNFTSYIWSTGSTDTTINVDSSDTYWVTSELNGCYKTTTVDVNVLPSPVPLIMGDTVFCPGDSVLLNAELGYTSYLWSTSANDTLDSIYVTQGTYTVSVTDTNGCQGISDPININTFPTNVVIVGDTNQCVGDSVLLDAGPGFDTYLWSNGDTNQTTYVTAGQYTVDVTLNICSATSLVHNVGLTVVPTPVITGLSSFCAGTSITLDADSIGAGYDSFSWNTTPAQTSQTINVNQGDTFVVVGIIDGCTDTSAQFIVTEDLLPTPVITGDTLFCAGDSVLLNATAGYESYLWSTSVNDTLDSVYVTEGIYTVTATGSNGCMATSPAFNVDSISSTVTIIGNTTHCTGDSVLLDAGPGFDSYLWSSGAADTNQTVYVTDGTYSVTTTLSVCTSTGTHTVVETIVPTPVITGSNNYCAGNTVTLDADSIGTGYDSFIWNTAPQQTTQQIVLGTDVTVQVVGTINGCNDTSAQFTVSEIPSPSPVITGSLFYCSNDSAGTTLSTTIPYTSYVWSTTDITPTTIAPAGAVTVTVMSANGCFGDTNVTIDAYAPDNNITGVIGFCLGSSITIASDPGFSSYLWSSGEDTSHIVAQDGEYSVIVTDVHGCTDNDTVILVGNPIPTASFTTSPVANGAPNQPVVFTYNGSSNVDSWLWDFDVTGLTGASPSNAGTEGPHTVIFSEQGVYSISLEVVSDSGCVGATVQEFTTISDIIAPNVITPNGDEHNQFLVFKNLEYHPGNHLVVFNRWGGKVFEQTDYANDWNGGGHSEGTYFYILTVTGMEEEIKGTLTLLN